MVCRGAPYLVQPISRASGSVRRISEASRGWIEAFRRTEDHIAVAEPESDEYRNPLVGKGVRFTIGRLPLPYLG